MKYQHCLLLPFALILIGAGLMTLLYFGIGNLKPYTHTKDFRSATCLVTSSNISKSVPCTHYDSDDLSKVHHKSMYPCLVVLVNYTEEEIQMDTYGYPVHQPPSYSEPDLNVTEDGPNGGDGLMTHVVKTENKKTYIHQEDIMLYEDYESWAMTRKGGSNATCSVHVCNADVEDNEHDVESFHEDHGQVGQIFKCYFNPKDHTEVYSEVVSGNLVLHALVWPALAMGFGLFLLIVVAFLSCEVWICRNPKRAQRRMQGQTYELASYRENLNVQQTQRGWRHSPTDGRKNPDRTRNKRPGDGNNNSRLPKLSAAADIVRKWSLRGRSDRRSDSSDTAHTSRSFGGVPSRQWSITRADQTFCTT